MQNLYEVNPMVAAVLDSAGKDEILWLQGYIGPTDREYVRLYDSLSLTLFLDIAESDVFAFHTNADESDPWTRLAVRHSGAGRIGSRLLAETNSFSLQIFQNSERDSKACDECSIINIDDPSKCYCICTPNAEECKENVRSLRLFGAFLTWTV